MKAQRCNVITPMNSIEPNQTSRREFIKTSTAATVGGIIAAPGILGTKSSAASPGDPIRVGLVGCGGRGTGAAAQALKAGDDIHLVAVGDAFEKAIAGSLKAVSSEAGEEKVNVKADKMFVGLDAYQKVIDSGVDVVLLASAAVTSCSTWATDLRLIQRAPWAAPRR